MWKPQTNRIKLMKNEIGKFLADKDKVSKTIPVNTETGSGSRVD